MPVSPNYAKNYASKSIRVYEWLPANYQCSMKVNYSGFLSDTTGRSVWLKLEPMYSFSLEPSSFMLKNLRWTRHPLVGHLVPPAARVGRSGTGPEKAAEIEPIPQSFLKLNILVILPKLHTLKTSPLSFSYRLGDEAQVRLRKWSSLHCYTSSHKQPFLLCVRQRLKSGSLQWRPHLEYNLAIFENHSSWEHLQHRCCLWWRLFFHGVFRLERLQCRTANTLRDTENQK